MSQYKKHQVDWGAGFPLPGSKLYREDPNTGEYPTFAWYDPWGVQDLSNAGVEPAQGFPMPKNPGFETTQGVPPAAFGGFIEMNFAPPTVEFTSEEIAQQYKHAQENNPYGVAAFQAQAQAHIQKDNLYTDILKQRDLISQQTAQNPEYARLTKSLQQVEEQQIPAIPQAPGQAGHRVSDQVLENQQRQYDAVEASLIPPDRPMDTTQQASIQPDLYTDILDAGNNQIQAASQAPTFESEMRRLDVDLQDFTKNTNGDLSHDMEFARVATENESENEEERKKRMAPQESSIMANSRGSMKHQGTLKRGL